MIFGMVVFTLSIAIGIEVLSYVYVYSDEEYQDLAERTKNLGKKIQTLKKNILFGQGVKRRQQEKLIKVQEDQFREYHRQLGAVSIHLMSNISNILFCRKNGDSIWEVQPCKPSLCTS